MENLSLLLVSTLVSLFVQVSINLSMHCILLCMNLCILGSGIIDIACADKHIFKKYIKDVSFILNGNVRILDFYF